MALDGKFERGKIVIIEAWADREKVGDTFLVAEMLRAIVKAIEMTLHGDVEVHTYPTPELGFTARACVAVQHLHESYIVYDNWIE
ncbi:MAG TPA: hypothetical protein ENG71_02270 [Thermoplasmatales archaeon]|nr:hypothetical protein [Thermoplasmatales archaeon]